MIAMFIGDLRLARAGGPFFLQGAGHLGPPRVGLGYGLGLGPPLGGLLLCLQAQTLASAHAVPMSRRPPLPTAPRLAWTFPPPLPRS